MAKVHFKLSCLLSKISFLATGATARQHPALTEVGNCLNLEVKRH